MSGILKGIKVLDLSRYIAGAYCAKMLADMGADAIRVDDPGGSVDRDQPPFGPNGEPLQVLALNCNKRGITLNLRAEKGKPLLRKLVEWADVIVENFSLPAKKMFG
ncbi:MAG TPA: CoA transferase, partial [Syntrophales bacterium]|nr:CoA transferase [Syntrophales bacterium]